VVEVLVHDVIAAIATQAEWMPGWVQQHADGGPGRVRCGQFGTSVG